jgi:hypothetical protein
MAQSAYTSTGSDITSEQLKIIHKTINDNAPKVPFKLDPPQKSTPWMPKNGNRTENQKGNSDKKSQPKARF